MSTLLKFFAIIVLFLRFAHAADSLPATWDCSSGNPLVVDGGPVWRLDRLWPDDLTKADAYRPMQWVNDRWADTQDAHEGFPHASIRSGVLRLASAATRLGAEFQKSPALVYIAPADGLYGVAGVVANVGSRNAPTELHVLRRVSGAVQTVRRFRVTADQNVALDRVAVELAAGDELIFLPYVRHANGASVIELRELRVGIELADPDAMKYWDRLAGTPQAPLNAQPTAEEFRRANEGAIEQGGVAFPADSGVINVRAFGAVGDGVHDDTHALRAAYRSGGLIYIPDGVYLVSDTIEPPKSGTRNVPSRRVLQGQSREGTIIRLVDNALDYGDPTQPLPVVRTSWGAAQAFRNGVRDLTIDVGSGNPGAVALDFFANNQGIVDNVRLVSSDPDYQGSVGLLMDGHAGPLMVSRLEVIGFDIGIDSRPDESATFENVVLRHQRVAGMRARDRNFIRKLTSDNRVTALRAEGALTVLVGAWLTGEGDQTPAIQFTGQGIVSDVRVSGYAVSLDSDGQRLTDALIEQWTSSEPVVLDADVRSHLGLEVLDSPEIPWGDPREWKSVADFEPARITINVGGQAREVNDWTPALQAAIDSGAHTVYFPVHGRYDIYGTVHLRGSLRRLIGLERPLAAGALAKLHRPWDEPRPRFVVEDGEAPVVLIERFDSTYGNVHIEHRSERALVVRSMVTENIECVPGAGDLFLDDVIPGYVTLNGSRLFARQFNLEVGFYDRFLPRDRFGVRLNGGSTAWVLGMKTEQSRGKVLVNGRSRIELYAYVYSHTADNPFPMFQVHDGDMTVTVMEKVLRNAPHVAVVRRVRPDQTSEDFVRPQATIPLITCVRSP